MKSDTNDNAIGNKSHGSVEQVTNKLQALAAAFEPREYKIKVLKSMYSYHSSASYDGSSDSAEMILIALDEMSHS